MSNKIDWSKAPEFAEFNYKGNWWRVVNGTMFRWEDKILTGSFESGKYWARTDYVEQLTESMTPKPKTIYTQAMSDAGESVKAGMKFTTETGNDYIAECVNDKSVCFTDEDGFLVAITIAYAKPIDQRTDSEKAIDDIENFLIKDRGVHTEESHNIAEGIFNLISDSDVHGVTFTGES